MKSPLKSIEEAANYVGLSESSLYKLCSNNKIDFYKIGRYNKFLIEDLDEFIQSKKVSKRSQKTQTTLKKPLIK